MKQYTVRVSAALKKWLAKTGSRSLLTAVSEAEPICPQCSQPWKPVESKARIGLWVDDSTALKVDSLDQRSVWLRAIMLKMSDRCIVCERPNQIVTPAIKTSA